MAYLFSDVRHDNFLYISLHVAEFLPTMEHHTLKQCLLSQLHSTNTRHCCLTADACLLSLSPIVSPTIRLSYISCCYQSEASICSFVICSYNSILLFDPKFVCVDNMVHSSSITNTSFENFFD